MPFLCSDNTPSTDINRSLYHAVSATHLFLSGFWLGMRYGGIKDITSWSRHLALLLRCPCKAYIPDQSVWVRFLLCSPFQLLISSILWEAADDNSNVGNSELVPISQPGWPSPSCCMYLGSELGRENSPLSVSP